MAQQWTLNPKSANIQRQEVRISGYGYPQRRPLFTRFPFVATMKQWSANIEAIVTVAVVVVTALVVNHVEVYGLPWQLSLYTPISGPFGRPSDLVSSVKEYEDARNGVVPPPQEGLLPNLTTTWKCQRVGPYADVCVYENLCHDGEFWYFIDPDAYKKNKTRDPVLYPYGDFKTGVVYPRQPVPQPDMNQLFPFNGGGMRGKRRTPQYLAALGSNVTWVNEVPWMPAIQFPLNNIYYWASRVMPIYSARQLNSSYGYDIEFPPIDMLYVMAPEAPFSGEWHRWVREVAVGESVPLVYKGGPWHNTMSQSPSVWKCFKRAAITGTYSMAVEDPYTAWQFRLAMYAKLGIALPPKPMKKVLFWLRKANSGRSFYNLQAMLDIADKYSIPYTVVEKAGSFTEQVELVSSHGVIVAPHGAGLMNLMFMPPFGAVVEIFPYQTHHNLYSGIAAMVGVAHYPVHTFNGTANIADPVYSRENCSKLTHFELNHLSALCKSTVFQKPIWVDLYAFETALVNAWIHIGVNTDLRGMKPVPDPTTVTGWK